MCKGILMGSMLASIIVIVATCCYGMLKSHFIGGCNAETNNMIFNILTIAAIFSLVDALLLLAMNKGNKNNEK